MSHTWINTTLKNLYAKASTLAEAKLLLPKANATCETMRESMYTFISDIKSCVPSDSSAPGNVKEAMSWALSEAQNVRNELLDATNATSTQSLTAQYNAMTAEIATKEISGFYDVGSVIMCGSVSAYEIAESIISGLQKNGIDIHVINNREHTKQSDGFISVCLPSSALAVFSEAMRTQSSSFDFISRTLTLFVPPFSDNAFGIDIQKIKDTCSAGQKSPIHGTLTGLKELGHKPIVLHGRGGDFTKRFDVALCEWFEGISEHVESDDLSLLFKFSDSQQGVDYAF
jgi:hypothetical protein